MVWALKEISQSGITELVRETDRLEEGKENLLEVLRVIPHSVERVARDPTQCQCTLLNVARIAQIVHITHLCAAGTLVDRVCQFVRGGKNAERAIAELHAWAAVDAVRVREAAWRAAQILSIAQRYPFNGPFEAFHIFHAGTALAVIVGLPEPSGQQPSRSGAATGAESVWLHELEQGDSPSDAILSWIRQGGSACFQDVDKLWCLAAREQVLRITIQTLRRCRVWGVAENLRGATTDLLQREYGMDCAGSATQRS
jgi:hypothetical protein